jgi:Flp pilus assembly protein TadG
MRVGRTRSSRIAQALVEFVLVLPLLLLAMAVIVDLSRYIAVRLALESAARDAAQYAVSRGSATGQPVTASQVASRVSSTVPQWVGAVNVSSDLAATLAGDPAVRVTLSSPQFSFLPMPALWSNPFPVAAIAWYPRR